MARSNDTTVISKGTRIHARVSGSGDLEIQGFVEGEVSVTGEVIVSAEGLVGASISARRIVVRGAVRGDLIAEEAVHLEDGARVVGDVRSARIAIAAGALLRGYVATGDASERRETRSVARAAPKPAASRPAVAPPPPKREEKKREEKKRAREEESPKAARRTGVLAIAGGRKKGPPPPVVPALKKGSRAALKKKA